MLILYDYFRSSACYRTRIALYLKNLDFEIRTINLVKDGGEQLSESYEKINPQKLVPALIDEGKILTQSLAIIEYLDEKYPEPKLLPKDPYARALARSLSLIIAAEIHPLNNLRVRNYLTQELKTTETQSQQWYEHWIHKGFQALEQHLAASPYVGDFCFGDKPGIADICLVPQVANAERFKCSLEKYPLIRRINAKCQEHPAFIKAQPEASK